MIWKVFFRLHGKRLRRALPAPRGLATQLSYASSDADDLPPQPSEPLTAQEERRSYAAMIGCGSELA